MTLLTGSLFSYSYTIKIALKVKKVHIDALLTAIGVVTSTQKLDFMFVNANNVNAETVLD